MAGNISEWCADEYDDEYYGGLMRITSRAIIKAIGKRFSIPEYGLKCRSKHSVSPKENPLGPGTPVFFVNNDFATTPAIFSRTTRGGSWATSPHLRPSEYFGYLVSYWRSVDFLRCAHRGWNLARTANNHLGFRCSQDP